MKPVQTKHIGKAIAILASADSGHSPQSAGQIEQPSSSSQKLSPQTDKKRKHISEYFKAVSSFHEVVFRFKHMVLDLGNLRVPERITGSKNFEKSRDSTQAAERII